MSVCVCLSVTTLAGERKENGGKVEGYPDQVLRSQGHRSKVKGQGHRVKNVLMNILMEWPFEIIDFFFARSLNTSSMTEEYACADTTPDVFKTYAISFYFNFNFLICY